VYTALRNVHLALGLFSSLFLLAYGVSAFEMAHSPLFRWTKAEKSESSLSIPAAMNPRQLAKHLMEEHDLRGDLMKVETTSIALRLEIVRPGVVHRVEVDTTAGTAVVKTEKGDLIRTLNRIHHLSGMWHEYWVINAWAWLLLLVSIALFGTGASGLYLWIKRTAERRIGTVLIAVSLVWGGSLLVLVRLG
jgi:hypothetical protein